jgi:hypothetical protein
MYIISECSRLFSLSSTSSAFVHINHPTSSSPTSLIKKPNQDHAHRLLQCLVVAIRPLRADELAEVLAVDFDDADGIPKLNLKWRWEDEEQALLTSCSSLIAIVESGGPRVVQFSHFSVREFLTSTCLTTSSGDLLHYHIALEPVHTILGQACMSILLRLDDRNERSSNDVVIILSRRIVPTRRCDAADTQLLHAQRTA